jgi:phosphoribosylformimino-5-aminoimidazole carboxamide ribotide isomerase
MGLDVIPVIDLLAGRVVHARRGERHAYAPIVSRLCASADAGDVVAALAEAFDPRVLYVADLDALQGREAQHRLLRRLAGTHPGRTFWIDAGVRDANDLAALAALANVVPVLATESLEDGTLVYRTARAVLSLDFRGDTLVDRARIGEAVDRWPGRVIVMTLARVGSDAGPDLSRLAAIRSLLARGGRTAELYLAGGVRDGNDLDALVRAGADGVLVASALHDARLTPAEVARYRR